MREQVITPRAGRTSGAQAKARGATGGVAQQRRAKPKAGGGAISWRGLLRYAPLAFKVVLAVATGLALFAGYRAAASASFFQLHSVDVEGAARTSKDEIRSLVRRRVAGVGVWRADLAAISAELNNQPWVKEAVVSRVLPSGVRVRVREREPRLVIRTQSGRFVWADEDGVLLGAAQPSDRLPPFFVRGLDEAPTDSARADNRERVSRALEMAREWGAAGLAGRISEVNLEDLRDVRAQLSGDDAQIEVRLGKEEFSKRLERALKVLDGLRNSPRGTVVRLDATQEKKVIVGFGSNALPVSEGEPQTARQDVAPPRESEVAKVEADATTRTGAEKMDADKKSDADKRQKANAREAKRERERARAEETKKAERGKKEEKKVRREGREEKSPSRSRQPATAVTERPRRVG